MSSPLELSAVAQKFEILKPAEDNNITHSIRVDPERTFFAEDDEKNPRYADRWRLFKNIFRGGFTLN